MKSLIFAGTLFLSAFTTIPTVFAPTAFAPTAFAASYIDSINTEAKFIHIDDSTAIPNNVYSRNATYQIDLHVSGKYALSALAIALPADISVGSVEVVDGAGKPIDANASVNSKNIAVAFNRPITSESYLQVRLKEVSTRRNYAKTWLLPVSVKLDGISDEIPLSLARIQTYSR